jgi:putative ABC transport system ATP-binding protein
MERGQRVEVNIWDAVYVEGVLDIESIESPYGTVGHQVLGSAVKPYGRRSVSADSTLPHPAVRIQDLVFAYGSREPVLDIEHLEVPSGEKVFLHGPSGSGKTTLLGLITGVLRAERGTVRILGTDLGGLSGRGPRCVPRGAPRLHLPDVQPHPVPDGAGQHPASLPGLAGPAGPGQRFAGAGSPAARGPARDRTSLLDSRPGELSVGQQQRVAAARALIGRPRLVVADEPTSALDSDRRELFLDLLFDSCTEAGATLLFVSHDRSLEGRFDRSLSLTEVNRALVRAT